MTALSQSPTSRPIHALLLTAASTFLVTLSSHAADEVILSSGERFTGTIIEQTDESITLEHRFGTLVIPRAEVDTLTLEAADDTDAQQGDGQGDEEIVPEAETASEWSGHLDIGGSAAFGNTDSQGFHITVTLGRESERDATTIDAGYFYGASNGDRNTNKFSAGIRQDWLVPETPWFYFAQGRYDYDEFQSWEHRLSGHGGVGYQVYDTEKFKLALRGGLGVAKEWNEDDLKFEALLGADLAWQITDRQAFELSTTLYPELSDVGEFRWVTTAAYTVLVDPEVNMSVAAGLRNEYQSRTEGDIRHNDLYIFAGLQFDF